MNKIEMKKLLECKNIPLDVYTLNGGLPNEAYCLSEVKNIWEVYYSERGVKSQLKQFNTENEACEYMYDKILELFD